MISWISVRAMFEPQTLWMTFKHTNWKTVAHPNYNNWGIVVSILRTANREVQISNPSQGRKIDEISAPPVTHSQLIYDEYTDCTLSVGR